MTDFRYADKDDKLTQELITNEFDAEYWGRSEDLLLRRAEACLKERLGEEKLGGMTLLDLGCGMGRLIPRFASLFGHVVGLEPDPERCAEAAALIEREGVSNAEAIHTDLAGYLEAHPHVRFDAVLCSHIFQHISHELFIGILRDLAKCTDSRTAFLFTTTYVFGDANQYSREFFSDGVRKMEVIDYAGFLDAMGKPGVLPVCRFARPWMEKLLSGFGLRTELFSAYHFADEHDETADEENNRSADKLKKARDAMYICARKEDSHALEPGTMAGKVCYMQFFSYEGKTPKLSALPRAATDERTEKIRGDFRTAEGFLLSGEPHFQTERTYFTDIPLRLKDVPVLDAHAVLSVYPEVSVCQVSVCLQVGETDVQDYVYLHQLQCSPAQNFRSGDRQISIPELCAELLRVGGFVSTTQGATGYLLEINRFGDKTDARHFTEREQQCLYGLLTGDEGWRHVPIELASARMEESWTSRDFVKVIAFSNSYLLFNLNCGGAHEDYLAGQYGFQHRYYNGMNDYFTMNAATAGVNHGVFFSAETGLIIKTATDKLLASGARKGQKHGSSLNQEIKDNKRHRAELIRMLNKVENVKISEVGALDALVLRQLDVSQRVESIRSLLELLESDLDLLYSTDTNRMVTFLTILGLAFALIQIILGMIPLL